MQAILMTLVTQALQHAPEVLLFVVTSILLPFAVKWIRANASTAQLKMIQAGADVAYEVVNSIARTTPSRIDDKAAVALDVFRKDLRMKISKADEPKFKAVVTAKHELEKRTKIAVSASTPSGIPVRPVTQLERSGLEDDSAAAALLPRR